MSFAAGNLLKRLFKQFTGCFVQRVNMMADEYSKIQRRQSSERNGVDILLFDSSLIRVALQKHTTKIGDDKTFICWLLGVFV